jgi:uncharacterized protein VirK/YbjX
MKQKFLRLIGYVIFNKKAFRNSKSQFKLIVLLKYFTDNKLVHFRTNLYHLTDYLSGSFSTGDKIQILIHHYSYLRANFTDAQLRQLFNEGIECYTECIETDKYSIVLTGSSTLEFEGSLSLFFKLNDVKIATLSFTIIPGSTFNLSDQNLAYITCMQRIGEHKDSINKAIKYFRDIIPSFILMKSFEAILSVLNISNCIGVSYTNQITALKNENKENYYSFYDELWMNYGGINITGNYLIPLPLTQKPILLIKQTHRNRTIKKRNKLKEIYNASLEGMRAFVAG